MLYEKNYHRPYIPSQPSALPYVGGELEALTSNTPFWRGQGIPICEPCKPAIRYGAIDYGAITLGLAMGSKGQSVRDLQTALNAGGAGLDVDGDFGTDTQAALKNYQRANGLAQTGTVDTSTLAKLNASSGSQTAGEKTDWLSAITQGVTSFTQTAAGFDQPDIVVNQSGTPAPQGMSTGTKIAIGVGSVALVGLIVVLASRGGE